MSSGDSGASWDHEATLYFERDLREPFFLSIEGKLIFSFFQGGTNPIDFEPFGLFRMLRLRPGEWTEPELYGHDGEVVWEIVKENGTAFSQSYSGNYSTPGDAQDLGVQSGHIVERLGDHLLPRHHGERGIGAAALGSLGRH